MNPIAVLIFLGFCAVSAGVAVLADNLGRKLGKKRLTLFGMRPKNFAMLSVALAGFFIPLLTLGLGYWASNDVRVILQKGATAAEDLAKTEDQLRKSKTDLERLQSESTQKSTEIHRLQGTQEQLKSNETQLKSKIGKSQVQLGDLRKKNETLAQTAQRLRSETATLNASVRNLGGQVKSMTIQYKALQDSSQRARVSYDKLQKDQAELNKHQVEVDLQIQTAERQLKETKQQLKDANIEFEKAQALATKNLDETRKQLAKARTDFEDAQRALDGVRQDATRLLTIANNLQNVVGRARTSPMAFLAGEEISRTRVPAGLSNAEAKDHLLSAFRTARSVAADHKASPDANGFTADFRELVSERNQVISVSQQEADLVNGLSHNRDQSVVVFRSFFNSFEGEPVWVIASALPNPIVYRMNAVVSETIIDGKSSRDHIIAELTDWLRTKVADSAARKGMIPARGKESPFGELQGDRLISLIDDIRSTSRNVRVQAFVSKDIRAADTLDLEFRLR